MSVLLKTGQETTLSTPVANSEKWSDTPVKVQAAFKAVRLASVSEHVPALYSGGLREEYCAVLYTSNGLNEGARLFYIMRIIGPKAAKRTK
jgi:hypothetical protein